MKLLLYFKLVLTVALEQKFVSLAKFSWLLSN